jgi:hypothetical protein
MSRAVRLLMAGWLLAGTLGCCSSPYRRWQDYIGWNDPAPDHFFPYPPPPVTTPPGPTTPAALPPPPSVAE